MTLTLDNIYLFTSTLRVSIRFVVKICHICLWCIQTIKFCCFSPWFSFPCFYMSLFGIVVSFDSKTSWNWSFGQQIFNKLYIGISTQNHFFLNSRNLTDINTVSLIPKDFFSNIWWSTSNSLWKVVSYLRLAKKALVLVWLYKYSVTVKDIITVNR